MFIFARHEHYHHCKSFNFGQVEHVFVYINIISKSELGIVNNAEARSCSETMSSNNTNSIITESKYSMFMGVVALTVGVDNEVPQLP